MNDFFDRVILEGDTVSLKCGPPGLSDLRMTVDYTDGAIASCVWYDESGAVHRLETLVSALKKVE